MLLEFVIHGEHSGRVRIVFAVEVTCLCKHVVAKTVCRVVHFLGKAI